MVDQGSGRFEAAASADPPYRIRAAWPAGITEPADPYNFGLLLSEDDIYLFAEGRHFDLSTRLGANLRTINGVAGQAFVVCAPNAAHVADVGDFNGWDLRRHSMRRRRGPGIWSCSYGINAGSVYKYGGTVASGERLA